MLHRLAEGTGGAPWNRFHRTYAITSVDCNGGSRPLAAIAPPENHIDLLSRNFDFASLASSPTGAVRTIRLAACNAVRGRAAKWRLLRATAVPRSVFKIAARRANAP